MSRLIHKLFLLTIGTSLTPAAFGDNAKSCSGVYATQVNLNVLAGASLWLSGLGAVAVPVTARALSTLEKAEMIVEAERILEIGARVPQFSWVKKYELALMAGGFVSGVIGRRILRRSRFDEALYMAIRETEGGVVGEYTRGMANLVNQAVFSGYEYASGRIPVKLKLPRRQRSQLSGALNGRRITVDEFAVILAELMAERTICHRLQKPAEWVEQVVMMQTRDQSRSSR